MTSKPLGNRSVQVKTCRLFIAVALPEAVRQLLTALQRELRHHDLPVRWVAPDNVHLTITFLGDTAPQKVEAIAAAMHTAANGHRPMRLEVAGCGVFPRLNHPRVLWVGLKGDIISLTDLKKALDGALAESDAGFEKKDRRVFRPHLTVGRFRHKVAPQKTVAAFEVIGQKGPLPFEVDRFHLFKSTLKPQGAVYTRLKTENLTP